MRRKHFTVTFAVYRGNGHSSVAGNCEKLSLFRSSLANLAEFWPNLHAVPHSES